MRRSIALVLAAGLLPMIALSGAFGIVALRSERAAVRTGVDAASRFIATLSSVKLNDGMHEVDMIAQSPAFDGPIDAERFRILAQRLRGTNSSWRYLSIADPSGRRLLDVPTPMGGALGPVIDKASLRQAVATRKPVVGNVLKGPRGHYAFAIRAPVVRDGAVRYVVSAVIPAESAGRLLQFRALPEGWRAGLLDGAGNIVASTLADSKLVGRAASEGSRAATRSGKPGFYDVQRLDGTPGLAVWQPIPGTNWSAHVSIPTAAYTTANKNALTLLIVVAILCCALLALIVRLLVSELRQLRRREADAIQHQRLEALGRLTGGVAHDFNNLLQPVLSGLDLLSRRIGEDEKSRRYIALAMAGAERARALVARLLAFARQQPLASAPVDVALLLGGICELVERSISPVAQLRLDVPQGLPPVQADASQLELAVMNLAINARDAMPDGGTVSITAAPLNVTKATDLAPGHYVAITVTDTGTGMDEATMRQAIDPFFTTKAADKGTGLGLSMVHGFAVQSGGALRLSSTLGVGTSASIVMPVASEAAKAVAAPTARPEGQGSRILLVDDDQAVRRSIAEVLREAGHMVTEAGSVNEGLAVLTDGAEIDLVITDYLMPERSGGDLCRELAALRPQTPVLLITGYEAGDVPDAIPRLLKPFRSDELLARVGSMLAGKAPSVAV